MTLKEVLDRKPTSKQSDWLRERIDALQPRALAMLEDDLNHARQIKDMLGMFITLTVAEKLEKGAIGSADSISETRKELLSGSQDAQYVWKISNVRGTVVGDTFADERGASRRLTLTAKPGSEFLRVTAHIENVSEGADRPYAIWSVSDMKRAFAVGFGNLVSELGKSKKEGDATPSRWLEETFIFLVSSSSEAFPCALVCGTKGLGSSSLEISGADGAANVIAIPHQISRGEGLDIDVLFSVPKGGGTGYRLLIFGGPPTEVK